MVMSIAGCYILQSCTIQHEPEMKIVFQYKRSLKLRKLPLRKRVIRHYCCMNITMNDEHIINISQIREFTKVTNTLDSSK